VPAIVTTIDIDRPADDVFAYATDPTRFHEWQHGVVSGHMDAHGKPTVGTKCHTTRRIGGAERPSVSELTHIDPPKTWGVRGIDGPIRAIVEVTVQPLSAGRSQFDHQRRLHWPRHRKGPGAAGRAPRSGQRDARQPGHPETAPPTAALTRRGRASGQAR
jgi:uncharacterized protein YndB with AHSA1/START domain